MEERNIIKTYTNGEITVTWQPGRCMHSAKCFRGLPAVFDPQARPWITMSGASSDEIKAQIDKCPSGALSWKSNHADQIPEVVSVTRIELADNGPLIVHGNFVLKDQQGEKQVDSKVTALCRCGHSSKKPFCDGTHRKINFQS